MKLSETAQVLALVQSFNNRTVGEKDVIAWQSVLADVDVADAEEAVRRYYAEETDWIMPAHVRRLVRDIVREREIAEKSTGYAPGQYGVLKADAMPEIAGPVAEGELTPSVRALLESVRAMLPEGSREALMPRRTAWEREHRAYVRTRDAEPNPLYRARTSEVCRNPGHEHFPGDPVLPSCAAAPLTAEPIYQAKPEPVHRDTVRGESWCGLSATSPHLGADDWDRVTCQECIDLA